MLTPMNVIAAASGQGYRMQPGTPGGTTNGYSRGNYGVLVPENKPVLDTGALIGGLITITFPRQLILTLNADLPNDDSTFQTMSITEGDAGMLGDYQRSTAQFNIGAGTTQWVWEDEAGIFFVGTDYAFEFV